MRVTDQVILAGMAVVLMVAVAARGGENDGVLRRLDVNLHGFADVRAGARTQDDLYEDDLSLAETRLQLDLSRMGDLTTLQVRADLVYDGVTGERTPDLEDGTGFLDLREANLLLSPHQLMDIKVGRQILTWGTGDLLFINDMFPKDWQSFFTGRDEEYLKAPSDAVFVSIYPEIANINVAYMPRFDPDRYISGERLSYWNPLLGRRAGDNAVMPVRVPDDWADDDEVSVRVSRNVGGYELALYGYHGFWKSPMGMDMAVTNATFPALAVYGASIRGSLGPGLFHVEAGYYDSRDDTGGADPFVPNGEARLLAGYEREIARDFTAAVQYYVEWMQDYSDYTSTLPAGAMPRDEDRHVATLRLTRRLMNQNLMLSLFAYYSPSDQDAYLRPYVRYKASDAWLLLAGGNVFIGEDDHTFFGQFEKNSNAYVGARYSF